MCLGLEDAEAFGAYRRPALFGYIGQARSQSAVSIRPNRNCLRRYSIRENSRMLSIKRVTRSLSRQQPSAAFGMQLGRRGIEKTRGRNGNFYHGLTLRSRVGLVESLVYRWEYNPNYCNGM